MVFRSTARTDNLPCPSCYCLAVRQFGFNYKPPMQEHFNSTTGQVVRTDLQFNTQLKRMAELASLRTGIEHTFQPVTPTTKESLGVTTAGLYETEKYNHDQGLIS